MIAPKICAPSGTFVHEHGQKGPSLARPPQCLSQLVTSVASLYHTGTAMNHEIMHAAASILMLAHCQDRITWQKPLDSLFFCGTGCTASLRRSSWASTYASPFPLLRPPHHICIALSHPFPSFPPLCVSRRRWRYAVRIDLFPMHPLSRDCHIDLTCDVFPLGSTGVQVP